MLRSAYGQSLRAIRHCVGNFLHTPADKRADETALIAAESSAQVARNVDVDLTACCLVEVDFGEYYKARLVDTVHTYRATLRRDMLGPR
jgi:hypothetical protein